MVVIATMAWIGSLRWDGRLWNALLMFAEMVPMSIILIAASVFAATGQQDKVLLGTMIHIPLITLEIDALLWKAPWLARHRDAHDVRQFSSN